MYRGLSKLRRKKETSAIKVDEWTGEIIYDGGTVNFIYGEVTGNTSTGALTGRGTCSQIRSSCWYVYFELMFKTMSEGYWHLDNDLWDSCHDTSHF